MYLAAASQAQVLSQHTFGHGHWVPEPLPFALEHASADGACKATGAGDAQDAALELDERVRRTGEW